MCPLVLYAGRMDLDHDAAREQLRTAGEELREIRPRYDAIRGKVRDAILAAINAGLPQREISELTGYTRENLRKIARAEGIGPG